ncbi:serine/threonine-protein kinase [Sulfuritalea hydrogenivorans]|uniref:Serine/threonine protein kinase n=1 Tax=Sulfuritalea hydrogenivorans sk43H TaxID=1223802 RepID=W0SJG3_9PROT|nr:serine/threonine-protein kinase [Sulfuritalea hydrogenivorans]MDK9714867.1 serine/threonine-protein kinase [Sulfuritalea sp.]BAO30791.1 serine/threonine protein kinase [Sulfuritalea hydrogenivorans sk43H]
MAIPERIGKYEIRKKLGEGATSIVYLGYDPFAEREVAVKAIFPEVLRDKERGRLYRHLLMTEASLAGKLMHPHIVQIFDAVLDEEQSYIVMEYVSGGTLEPFCSPSTLLPVDRLVEIIFKCTRALDYAFRAGITHRDIKPANILLVSSGDSAERSSGDIKISDFGAAMMTSGEQTRTQVSGVGSPAYMSPQQVRDMTLNHQTDIYSLGVVMYQLLTGRLPFQSTSNYGMIYQICNTDPPPPSTFRSDMPTSLDAVVARAMQKEIEARYQSWEEFSHDLAQSFRNKQLSAQRQAFPDSEKFEALRALRFFNEFSDVDLWEVVRFSRWDEVAAGTVIMRDGERGDFFAFLLDGELMVSKSGHSLGTLAAGECFGEMAIIRRGQHTRGADVVAQTGTRVVTISAQALQHASDVCRMHFYQGFLDVIAGRLADANARLASL